MWAPGEHGPPHNAYQHHQRQQRFKQNKGHDESAFPVHAASVGSHRDFRNAGRLLYTPFRACAAFAPHIFQTQSACTPKGFVAMGHWQSRAHCPTIKAAGLQ